MNSEPVYPHFSTSVWLPNGQRVFFTIPIDRYETAYEAALEFTNMLLSKGATSQEPGLDAGESKELIKVIMRREKPSDGTPIIDMYPEWGTGGDEPFGTYKYVHTYLNTPEQIAEFLHAAGLKSLEQIPLYDGQTPLKRSQGRKHAKEFTVPTPFYAVRKQGDEKTGSDGQAYRPWMLTRLESTMPQKQPPQGRQDAPAAPKGKQAAKAQETPQTGDKHDFVVSSIEVTETKDGKRYYKLTGDDEVEILAFSRDLFRAWGYPDELTGSWEDGVFGMPEMQRVQAKLMEKKDGSGSYWAAIIPEVTF